MLRLLRLVWHANHSICTMSNSAPLHGRLGNGIYLWLPWSMNLPKKSIMSNCQNHIPFSLERNMGRPFSTELWTIGSCQVTSSGLAGRDTWNYEMLRRQLPPAIRLCSPCPCRRIQASKSAYRRCEPWPSHRDLSDPGTHQSYADNRKQPPLPFLWGNHSFFMPASQTSKLTCFAQAMLGHKISGPSSSQHLPWTNPQCCKCPCNLQATKKHCRMTLSILLGSHRSQSLRKLDVIHVLSGFQDACVGQLLWIESGCCSDLAQKKHHLPDSSKETPNTWVFWIQRVGFFWSSRPIEVWGLPPGRFETPTSTSKIAKLRCVVPKISGRTLEHRDRCPQNLNMTERCLSKSPTPLQPTLCWTNLVGLNLAYLRKRNAFD